jgi:hypothetical protein
MRNAEYIPVAQIPMVDLSAQYEAAVARREEAELRKLQYLNQFQKTRGRIAEGLRPEVEKYWNEIQDSLDSGDMSFEAKKKRQELYNNYANIAADALDWTRELDEREATILASPDKFSNPSELLSAIEEDRFRTLSPGAIQGELAALPSLSKFYRFKMREMTPGATAASILDNLKKGGGINKVYDPTSGNINEDRLDSLVNGYFLANQFSKEEEDMFIVNAMRRAGVLGETVEDASKIQNLSNADRAAYLNEGMSDVRGALKNLLASDIETEREKEAADLRNYAAKVGIQGRQNEREIALRASLDNQALPVSNPYASLASYLNENLSADLIPPGEDGLVEEDVASALANVLSPIGFEVIAPTNPLYERIQVINKDGKKFNVDVEGKSPEAVVSAVKEIVINGLPGADETERIMNLKRLEKTQVLPVVNSDPLGILTK